MRTSISEILIPALVAAVILVPMLLAEPGIKRVPAHPTTALSGQELFHEYCAVCHGVDAKGGGPAAAALLVKPDDLTQIARKNGNKYPEVKVQRIQLRSQAASIVSLKARAHAAGEAHQLDRELASGKSNSAQPVLVAAK